MYSKQDSFPPLSTFKGGLAQYNKVSPNGTFNEIDLMHLKVIEQKGASTPLPKDPTGHLSFTTYHVSTSPISSVSSSPDRLVIDEGLEPDMQPNDAQPNPNAGTSSVQPVPTQSLTPSDAKLKPGTGTETGTQLSQTPTLSQMIADAFPASKADTPPPTATTPTALNPGTTANPGTGADSDPVKRVLSFSAEGNDDAEDGFTYVSYGKRRKQQTVFEDIIEVEETADSPNTISGYMFMTFSLLNRGFIDSTLAGRICKTFYEHIGQTVKVMTANTELTFKLPQHLYNKAKQFVNQSSTLPTLKVVNKSNKQTGHVNKHTKQANKNTKPKYSKGIVETNGANETQFRDTFAFGKNNISSFQPIYSKHGKNTGRAILTFETSLPPLFIEGTDQIKAVKPMYYTPVRCNKCQEFGHRDSKCKSTKTRCTNCSSNHLRNECRVDFRRYPFRCYNCNDNDNNHTANHPMCPAWLKYKEEIRIKNMTITQEWEARRHAHFSTKENNATAHPKATNIPHSDKGQTYAQALSPKDNPAKQANAQPQVTPPTHVNAAPLPDLKIPEQAINAIPSNKNFIHIKDLTLVLKHLLSSDNLARLQNMQTENRDKYLELLVASPHFFIGTEDTPIVIEPDTTNDMSESAQIPPAQANTAKQQPAPKQAPSPAKERVVPQLPQKQAQSQDPPPAPEHNPKTETPTAPKPNAVKASEETYSQVFHRNITRMCNEHQQQPQQQHKHAPRPPAKIPHKTPKKPRQPRSIPMAPHQYQGHRNRQNKQTHLLNFRTVDIPGVKLTPPMITRGKVNNAGFYIY